MTEKPLKTIIAELTYRCNLACIYCHNPPNKEFFKNELKTTTWKRVIREAKELGVLKISFTGGEPLLRNDLAELVKYAREIGFFVHVDTNGTLMNNKIIDSLIDAGLDSIQISIPAVSQSVLLKITKKTLLNKRLFALKKFVDAEIYTVTNTVLNRYNANVDEIKKIINVGSEIGVNKMVFQFTYIFGNAINNFPDILPLREQVRDLMAFFEKYNKIGKTRIIKPSFSYSGLPIFCRWGKEAIVITPNGYVTPCEPSSVLIPEYKFENIKNNSLKIIWEKSKMLHLFDDISILNIPKECKKCPFLSKCRGGCRIHAYLISNDLYKIDPFCKFSEEWNNIQQYMDH